MMLSRRNDCKLIGILRRSARFARSEPRLASTRSPGETTTHRQARSLRMANKVRVAIVGLGFGAEFIPIYQAHPDADMYAICQRNAASLQRVGEQFAVAKRYTNYEELIKDPS